MIDRIYIQRIAFSCLLGAGATLYAADALKPCSLLTDVEVGEVLGNKVSKMQDMAGPKICKYVLSNGDQLAINASSGNPPDYLDKQIKKLGPTVTLEPASDIGDKAYLRTGSPSGIYLQKGDVYISMVAVMKTAPSADAIKNLANKAAGRAK